MKKLLFALTAITMIFTLAACGGGNSGKGGSSTEKKVAVVTPYLASVTTNEKVELFKQIAEDRGWKPNVIDTKGDFAQLASRMEDMISTKVDAIVIVDADPNQVSSQIEKAAEQNIPVFGLDSGFIDGMTMNATSDNAEMGKMITEYLFETMGNQGNLVVLTHRPHPGVLKRTETMDEILQKQADIQLVVEQHVDVPGPIENARKTMESLLLANKEDGSITAVWAGWDEPAIGAAQAIEAAGRSGIVVVGIDGTSQAIEMIENDSPLIATVKQNFSGMAEIVANQIELVFDGKEVEDTVLYAPATLITKENAGQ